MLRQIIMAGAGALALAAVAPAAHAQNLLTNGSFETGDFTGWSGSVVTDTANNYIAQDLGYGLAEQGQYYLQFGGPRFETLTQTFATVAGEGYVVHGWFSGDGEGGASYSMQAGSQGVGGNGDGNYPGYTEATLRFQATGPTSTLTIFLKDPSSYGSADNFSVVDTGHNISAPEPAGVAMLGVGLLGLVGVLRRRD